MVAIIPTSEEVSQGDHVVRVVDVARLQEERRRVRTGMVR